MQGGAQKNRKVWPVQSDQQLAKQLPRVPPEQWVLASHTVDRGSTKRTCNRMYTGCGPMINGKRIAVVMPAYNAEKTLEMTVRDLSDLVDIKILVDDSSSDQTAELSQNLGVQTFI